MTVSRRRLFGIAVIAGFIILAASVIAPQTIFAGGGVGGGGGAGNCGNCGGASTNNGYGWYRYRIGSESPGGFRDGTSWSYVSNLCSSSGNDEVVAFIIQTGAKTPSKAVVYKYVSGQFGTYYLYKGNSGGRWLTYSGAKSLYDSVDAKLKVGFSWGSNVAWFCYTNTPPWTIAVTSVADRTTAKPGDTINWTHTVKNLGSGKTTKPVTYHYQNRDGLGSTTGPDQTVAAGWVMGAQDTFDSNYVVTQDDVDKNLCRNTSASPAAIKNSGWVESNPSACVSVPYDYTLTPLVTSASGSAVEGGSSVTVDLSVTNSGPTKSKQTDWILTQMQVEPGTDSVVPNASGGDSADDPCGTYFTNPYTTCKEVASGEKSVFSTSGAVLSGDVLASQTLKVEDLPVGTRLCYALSVKPRSSSSNEWAHSAPVCVTVSKKPKVQILGGDLSAGTENVDKANIMTATTTKSIDGTVVTFGSWTEYAVLTNGIVVGMASGSGYHSGSKGGQFCDVSLLTFTNADGTLCTQSSVKGNYLNTDKLLNVSSAFPVTSTEEFKDLDDSSKRRVETSSKAITIEGGTIEKGDWLVINAPDQTVTVKGNIEYTSDKLESIKDIPQLVIIAKQINIDQDVTRVDAWLIATGEDGSINTCSNYAVSAPLTYKMCDKELVVNGPVAARSLYLRRTAGAGLATSTGDPAEIFNLRPDAYLWSIARSQEAGRIQSVYTTELPPRF